MVITTIYVLCQHTSYDSCVVSTPQKLFLFSYCEARFLMFSPPSRPQSCGTFGARAEHGPYAWKSVLRYFGLGVRRAYVHDEKTQTCLHDNTRTDTLINVKYYYTFPAHYVKIVNWGGCVHQNHHFWLKNLYHWSTKPIEELVNTNLLKLGADPKWGLGA